MDEVRIFEVTEAKSEYADAISRLLPQLSSTPHVFTADTLQRLVDCETTHLFLLEEAAHFSVGHGIFAAAHGKQIYGA